jgi:hypothetical protein
MKRKLFFAVAFVSFAICAGCVWWWVGSGSRMDHFSWQGRSGSTMHVLGTDGKVMFTRTVASAEAHDGQITWGSDAGSTAGEPQLQWTSFTYTTRPSPAKTGGIESTLILPAWAIVGGSALLPLMWMGGKIKPKKKAH